VAFDRIKIKQTGSKKVLTYILHGADSNLLGEFHTRISEEFNIISILY